MYIELFKYTVNRELTISGDRLPVTSVEGLSATKLSLRCWGNFSDQSSSSEPRADNCCSDNSCEVAAGYTFSRTLARMREARNNASALDKRVYSPGKVGWKPFSVTYSSSVSEGYSAWMSSSLRSLGRPSIAAEKLKRQILLTAHSPTY